VWVSVFHVSSHHFNLHSRACSCHGPAIFPGVIDPSTNKSIIHGKTITGFTTQGEYDMEIMDIIRGWGEPLVDEWAERLGAKCESLIQGLLWNDADHRDEQMKDHLECGTTSILLMDAL
jgi:hypothetical protein